VHPCTWRTIVDGGTTQVEASGGDLVIVTFVSP
jgi:hypothetical protein